MADPFLEQHFTYTSTVRATCKVCGEDMDVRAGRARKHLLKVHRVGGAPELTIPAHSEPGVPVASEPAGVEPPVTTAPPTPTKAEPQRSVGREGAPSTETERSSPKGPARGSREWAVELVLSVADRADATPEQKLKALDLLKEYESFESAGNFDDEAEREKFMAQWDRAISRAKTLRDLEKSIFRDPLTRQDVLRSLQETV